MNKTCVGFEKDIQVILLRSSVSFGSSAYWALAKQNKLQYVYIV